MLADMTPTEMRHLPRETQQRILAQGAEAAVRDQLYERNDTTTSDWLDVAAEIEKASE